MDVLYGFEGMELVKEGVKEMEKEGGEGGVGVYDVGGVEGIEEGNGKW
ncbi:hypothetical protein [Bacillus mycoides]|nr:hypothetical protein [Bacillus mycoides]